MSDVVHLKLIQGDGLKLKPLNIFHEALNCNPPLETVVIVGIDEDGQLQTWATDGRPEAAMLLQRALTRMVKSYDD